MDLLGKYLEEGNGVADYPQIGTDVHPSEEGVTFLPCGGVLLAYGGRKALVYRLMCSIEVRRRLH